MDWSEVYIPSLTSTGAPAPNCCNLCWTWAEAFLGGGTEGLFRIGDICPCTPSKSPACLMGSSEMNQLFSQLLKKTHAGLLRLGRGIGFRGGSFCWSQLPPKSVPPPRNASAPPSRHPPHDPIPVLSLSPPVTRVHIQHQRGIAGFPAITTYYLDGAIMSTNMFVTHSTVVTVLALRQHAVGLWKILISGGVTKIYTCLFFKAIWVLVCQCTWKWKLKF